MLILFYHDTGLLDRTIQYLTHSLYNHCAVAFDDGVLFEANRFGICTYSGADAAAMIQRAAAVAHLDLDKERNDQTRAWCEHEVGSHYSISGLLCDGVTAMCPRFRMLIAFPHEYTCSGFAAEALTVSGDPRSLKLEPRTETPASLAAILTPVVSGA